MANKENKKPTILAIAWQRLKPLGNIVLIPISVVITIFVHQISSRLYYYCPDIAEETGIVFDGQTLKAELDAATLQLNMVVENTGWVPQEKVVVTIRGIPKRGKIKPSSSPPAEEMELTDSKRQTDFAKLRFFYPKIPAFQNDRVIITVLFIDKATIDTKDIIELIKQEGEVSVPGASTDGSCDPKVKYK